jgi:hypothetical protein
MDGEAKPKNKSYEGNDVMMFNKIWRAWSDVSYQARALFGDVPLSQWMWNSTYVTLQNCWIAHLECDDVIYKVDFDSCFLTV